MTTTLTYALEEFVHEMSKLVDEQPDQETLFDRGSAHLERLINNPDAIPEEYSIPMPGKNHGTYLLHYGDNGLLVTSVVWGPGDHIGPHDHRTWGMIGVVGNGITERRASDGWTTASARTTRCWSETARRWLRRATSRC